MARARDPFDPSHPRMRRTLALVENWRRNPPDIADREVSDALAEELRGIIAEALDANEDFAMWLALGFQEAASNTWEGIEALLARRPGSWEADSIRDLTERPVAKRPESASRVKLVDLLGRANDENVEIADWLAHTLGEVARGLRMRAEAMLINSRPGKRSDAVRQLVYGTIGWPGAELDPAD